MAARHPLQKMLAPLLAPLSFLYGGMALARRRLIERNILTSWLPPRPCISVGNISWGGTGKTPVIDWFLDYADKHDLAAVVLTRGYGARPPALPLRVTADLLPHETGDEPLMLARRHPAAAVLVDPDRNRAARFALHQDAPDLFLLDDGFQHVTTGRHLNLVLLDVDDVRREARPGQPPSQWNRVLPGGTWREPARALTAANAFLLKVEPEDWPELSADLAARLVPFPRPVFGFRLRPEGLRPCGKQEPVPHPATTLLVAADLPGPWLLISGVGNPGQVRHTAEHFMGRPPERHLIFPDHYDFVAHAAEIRAALADPKGKELPVISTAKDALKLDYVPHLFSLDVTADFFASLTPAGEPGDSPNFKMGPDFATWFHAWLKKMSACPSPYGF